MVVVVMMLFLFLRSFIILLQEYLFRAYRLGGGSDIAVVVVPWTGGHWSRSGSWPVRTVGGGVKPLGKPEHVPTVIFGVALIKIPVMPNAMFDNDDVGFVDFDGRLGGDDDTLFIIGIGRGENAT